MLACVGFIIGPLLHFIPVSDASPFGVISSLGLGPNMQVLTTIGMIELATWKMTFEDGNTGDLGFDPMNMLKKYDDKKFNKCN
jgi:hypothetical protein